MQQGISRGGERREINKRIGQGAGLLRWTDEPLVRRALEEVVVRYRSRKPKNTFMIIRGHLFSTQGEAVCPV